MPLYEAKMLHLYDTRWATYEPDGSTRLMTEEEKAERLNPMPRYWVHEADVDRKLAGRWDKTWFLGWRDICRSTDVRTVITTLGPRLGYGHKWMLCLPARGRTELQATWSSFAFDFVARQKLGGTSMSYSTIMQLPVPHPNHFGASELPFDRSLPAWLDVRVDRLNGYIPESEEQARVRAELDAAAFHLFGLTRDEASHVMDTFPIVKRKDEGAFGSYRTKELILEAYDAMSHAQAFGIPYKSPWTQEVGS